MKRTIILAFLLFSLLPHGLFAQLSERPFTISVFNEGTAIPFATLITTPLHPGLQLGTDWDYGEARPHGRFFQTLNLGYYYHNYFAQGIYLNTEAGYEYRSGIGLAGGARLGVGYLHTFATQKEYRLVDGAYQQLPDRGNVRVMPSIALELGYYLKKEEKRSTKLFLLYQGWVEYPFSPGFIPLMSHISLHAGLRFFPFAQKEAKNKEGEIVR